MLILMIMKQKKNMMMRFMRHGMVGAMCARMVVSTV